MNSNEIIKKLNDIRLSKNLSVYRLAELSEINQSTLANTFSRKTVPSIYNLEKICNAMGLTLSQFFQENETHELLLTEEKQIIHNLRSLSPETRTAIKKLLESVVKENK